MDMMVVIVVIVRFAVSGCFRRHKLVLSKGVNVLIIFSGRDPHEVFPTSTAYGDDLIRVTG